MEMEMDLKKKEMMASLSKDEGKRKEMEEMLEKQKEEFEKQLEGQWQSLQKEKETFEQEQRDMNKNNLAEQ